MKPEPTLRSMPFGPLLGWWMRNAVGLPNKFEAEGKWTVSRLLASMIAAKGGTLLDSRFGTDSTIRKYKNGDSFPYSEKWEALREALTENIDESHRVEWFDLLTRAWKKSKDLSVEDRKKLYASYTEDQRNDGDPSEPKPGSLGPDSNLSEDVVLIRPAYPEEPLLSEEPVEPVAVEERIMDEVLARDATAVIHFQNSDYKKALDLYANSFILDEQNEDHLDLYSSKIWHTVASYLPDTKGLSDALDIIRAVKQAHGAVAPHVWWRTLELASSPEERAEAVRVATEEGTGFNDVLASAWLQAASTKEERNEIAQVARHANLDLQRLAMLWVLHAQDPEEREEIVNSVFGPLNPPPISHLVNWMGASQSPAERQLIASKYSGSRSGLDTALVTNWMVCATSPDERAALRTFRKKHGIKRDFGYFRAWNMQAHSYDELRELVSEAISCGVGFDAYQAEHILWHTEDAAQRLKVYTRAKMHGLELLEGFFSTWMRKATTETERTTVFAETVKRDLELSDEFFSSWMLNADVLQEREKLCDLQRQNGIIPNEDFFAFWVLHAVEVSERNLVYDAIAKYQITPSLGFYVNAISSARTRNSRAKVYHELVGGEYEKEEAVFSKWILKARSFWERRAVYRLWVRTSEARQRSNWPLVKWMHSASSPKERMLVWSKMPRSDVENVREILIAWMWKATGDLEQSLVLKRFLKYFGGLKIEFVEAYFHVSKSRRSRQRMIAMSKQDGVDVSSTALSCWMHQAENRGEREYVISLALGEEKLLSRLLWRNWILACEDVAEINAAMQLGSDSGFEFDQELMESWIHASKSREERSIILNLMRSHGFVISNSFVSCWMHQADDKAERGRVYAFAKAADVSLTTVFWRSWIRSCKDDDERWYVADEMVAAGGVIDRVFLKSWMSGIKGRLRRTKSSFAVVLRLQRLEYPMDLGGEMRWLST